MRGVKDQDIKRGLLDRSGRLFCRRQAALPEQTVDRGRCASPGFVESFQILCVAARENHLPEAVAVGARQAAMLGEPRKCIVIEHLTPQIPVITR